MKIHTCAKQIPVRSMLGGGGRGRVLYSSSSDFPLKSFKFQEQSQEDWIRDERAPAPCRSDAYYGKSAPCRKGRQGSPGLSSARRGRGCSDASLWWQQRTWPATHADLTF